MDPWPLLNFIHSKWSLNKKTSAVLFHANWTVFQIQKLQTIYLQMKKKSKKLTYKKYISKCMHFSLTLNSAESVWQADENHS